MMTLELSDCAAMAMYYFFKRQRKGAWMD